MVIEIKYSVYPFSLDGTTQLPIAANNITPVIAEVVNRQRSAIVSIEGELGIDPSGVYTTVRARLDALESLIGTFGGGGGIESVSKNGIQIVSNATNLNFVGDAVNVINSGSGTARIEVLGTTTQVQESIAVDAPGDTTFTLSSTPLDAAAVQMYINGQKQQYGTDYTILGTLVTYSGVPALTITDDVEFWYLVSAFLSGGGSSGGESLSETLAIGNSTDGYDINLNFGSALISSDGTVLVNDDLHVTGKLTVDGLIDPPGLVLEEQATSPYDPSITGTEGLIWVRTDGYLMYTDQTNTDHVIDFDGVGGGGGGGGGITSIITTANGVSASNTITPSTSITSGAVTIDLPYISLEDTKVVLVPDFGITAADTTVSSVFIGASLAPSVDSAINGSLNVCIGYNALTSFNGGDSLSENVIIGAGACASASDTLLNNVVIGKSALAGAGSATSITGSIFIGYYAGPNSGFSTIGTDNIYIGRYAGSNIDNANAANSVLLGSNACANTSNVVNSVMIGDSVGGNPTPTRSIVIGRQSGNNSFNAVTDSQLMGDQIGTGAINSFIAGTQAGGVGGSAIVENSVLIGYNAGYKVSVTNLDSVIIGYRAAGAFVSDPVTSSVIIGCEAGLVTYGINNILLGKETAQLLTSGTNNTILGTGAGATLTTGSSNVLIGSGIDVPVAATSNYTSLNDILISNGTNTDIYEQSGGTLALRVDANTDIAAASTGQVLAKGASGSLEFIDVGSGGGGGDGGVSGPGITTDNAIARWSGTDGYTIQNSGIIIDNSDNITGAGNFNGVTVETHASRHESGGADEIDGYNIELIYAPINYDAPINDIIGEHLFKIDEALAITTFSNTTIGGGTPTVNVAPEHAEPITALTNTSNANYDFDPGVNGVFRFAISITVRRATGGEYRTDDYVAVGIRTSGTMAILGTPKQLDIGGDPTGLVTTITQNSGALRVNLENTTGETINGYIWIGPIRGDLIS